MTTDPMHLQNLVVHFASPDKFFRSESSSFSLLGDGIKVTVLFEDNPSSNDVSAATKWKEIIFEPTIKLDYNEQLGGQPNLFVINGIC